jgi:hypothetical protein
MHIAGQARNSKRDSLPINMVADENLVSGFLEDFGSENRK